MILVTILVLAAFIDYVIGDPVNFLHPVQVMGWAIAGFTNCVVFTDTNKNTKIPKFSPVVMKLWGIVLGFSLIAISGGITWLIISFFTYLDLRLGIVVSSILLASCWAGKSLRNAAEDVLNALKQESDNLIKARQRLSQYVGRDTENLTEPEILRAVLETITENAVDGVTAPLFYALLGFTLFLTPSVGVAIAMAYKAASTLDSMVGYRYPPYADLGWFSAKTEDVLTWLPCRLTVITLGLISGKPLAVWRICQRDAIADPSPNSGWSECIYAAILGVQVGGANQYRGEIKYKPSLGDDIDPITPKTIYQALHLTRICCLLWLGLGITAISICSFIKT
ncbi:cobalamin biosynthesis protein CobD [Synechococcus sp. PCC 7502]|uniref:adenosylcobinamide-phosphate synthase CbiB n=1 Tax=Synechococcus sp. PCC 7502 TaxID=1173263 RepID=UPI00029F876C|nr:adenosylcobinamide-phosphate synthase CbiB [Synechococcus sp. PCC 7502]AFY72284.1 cobalamin biosynthesis protein CobD [Synechococcus sp. PCC 7502]